MHYREKPDIKAILFASLFAGSILAFVAAQPAHNDKSPLAIKALIGEIKEKMETDRENFPSLIAATEALAEKEEDAPAAAVLHSMIAEMYQTYYLQNRRAIDRRTPIDGYVPEDIREWTSNLFAQKVGEEIKASLQPAGVLQQTPAAHFGEIMDTGKVSPFVLPALYDFLAHRAIDLQPSEDLYNEWLAFRRPQSDRRAAVIVELEYLNYLYTKKYAEKQDEYKAALDSLLRIHADKDYSVEIAHAQLSLLQNSSQANEDSLLAVVHATCEDLLARFPKYERIGLIHNRLAEMETPVLNVRNRNTVYPGDSLRLNLAYKNIRKVIVRIYQNSVKGKLLKEYDFTLPLRNAYTGQDTALSIPVDNPGLYEYEITAEKASGRAANAFSVSRLAAVFRTNAAGQGEVWVTDYMSGKPVPDADVVYYGESRSDMKRIGSVKTGKDGLAVLPAAESIYGYKAIAGTDTSAMITSIYMRPYHQVREARTAVRLFTDRGLYRPGQTALFKGIAYWGDPDRPQVIAGKTLEVILRDANNKEVARKTFTTNDYGSFYGEFTLPAQGLTGRFSLSSENYSTYIQVEAYKRPAFKADFLPVKEDIAFGDELRLQGKAQTFSGIPLAGGKAVYRIIRRRFFFRSFVWDTALDKQVAEGTASINSDGAFSFAFRPERSAGLFRPSYQSYEVIALVTDSKGETQEARTAFSVGDRSLVLTANLPNQIDKEKEELQIEALTLNGEPITVSGTYSISLLVDTGKEKYKETTAVAQGTFTSGKPAGKSLFAKLPSGRMRLRLSALDSKGRIVEEQQDFILYSRTDKRPPVFSHTWLPNDRITCLPGEEAEVVFGVSDRDAYILYELFGNGKNIARRCVTLSNESSAFKIPFLESYGQSVIASFSFIKAGELYRTQAVISRKRPDRSLTLKPEVFRDKLAPGSYEAWKFRLAGADSLPVAAEVLAAMYDASLDKIYPFAWSFSPPAHPEPYFMPFSESAGLRNNTGYIRINPSPKDIPSFNFGRLDWQGALDAYRPALRLKSASTALLYSEADVANASLASMAVDASAETAPVAEAGLPPQSSAPALPVRANFNETAFFSPTLQTDKEGNLNINFTLPESNTTWKLQTFAHTADLRYGLSTFDAVSRKPLMVLPNLPRFLRKGDEANITTQIINLSDKAAAGSVRLEFFNPSNEQVIPLPDLQKPVALQPEGTTVVGWTIGVPDMDGGLVGCRIIADTEAGSDGEQHLLPVLSNEVWVMESTPFYLFEEKEKQIKLPDRDASPTRRPLNMTLEISGNPVWYAVQALPTLAQPDNDNVVSRFASYYSNALAVWLLQANPHIRNIIAAWAAQGSSTSTLLSNLEKNEELKTLLLEETPWALEANTETEQKQRLSLLFDANRASAQREAAMQALQREQHETGGWGWFKGFYPSRPITLYILQGMEQLSRLGVVFAPEEKEMQRKALNYLDKAIQDDYERLCNYSGAPKDYLPSPVQVNYLYVRSLYGDIPVRKESEKAVRYFAGQAEKQWDKASLCGKGEIALLMHRNGNKDVAGKILARLRKTATTSPDKGMYWANNRRENFFSSPVSVHCLLMEVFRTIEPNDRETDRMKQWLLNQKQTQQWESTPVTANAIYSLFAAGSDWLAADNNCSVQWGDKTWNTAAGETGTGYLKATVDAQMSSHNTLTIYKEGNAPAWGAIYHPCFESIEKVGKQTGALSVEKKLFIENNNGVQRQITPVASGNPLKRGDKVIVRLTLRADRDMEYVSVKDLRAGCFEPASQLSGFGAADGLMYYHAPGDISEHFYFDRLPAGTYVLEYGVYVSRSGRYGNGMASAQCMYAPEFVSHTEGGIIVVEE